jgi:hypothetical protein
MDRGFLIRGAGAGAAVLLPGWRWRSAVLAGSYLGGWFGGERGIQVFSVTGVELPTSAASWTVLHLGAVALVRRLPLPRPASAAAYAGLVALADERAMGAVRARLRSAGGSA